MGLKEIPSFSTIPGGVETIPVEKHYYLGHHTKKSILSYRQFSRLSEIARLWGKKRPYICPEAFGTQEGDPLPSDAVLRVPVCKGLSGMRSFVCRRVKGCRGWPGIRSDQKALRDDLAAVSRHLRWLVSRSSVVLWIM